MTDPTSADQELRARRARSFGAHASAYAEHRPDYPLPALRWGLPAQAGHVLDLAAGTGKLTEGLLALGLRVTAVEPDPEMRAELVRRYPELPALDGTAERIPLADGEVDAVLVGQAFHWFDADRALAEIARVTRPGGTVVALWNHDDNSVPWVAEFDELGRTGVSRRWVSQARELPAHPGFEPFERERFRHAQRRTAQTLVDTIATHSHMLTASAEERAATLGRLYRFLERTPETAQGEFDLPIITTVIRAVRR
ncbi:class I SAM-dependent methyltransferase [Amycolatopsis acidiphila]|uniref:Class I SAM-dependent methyltransferase n=1 Tax=Amycolatopsis acidiphila TaxID=715473 RepID=A0A557ZS79_9PSEU|nr:class I SAM-dependent methyltransferase [Amycolatopsis acidiphila]TVT14880.1 class I SAM-dependent methyltransferase [Amycolatopsis acidiphila]UIJ59438.1 class I SAM-dependent methyltransferase [Amycolatopsis acidiphila]GHG94481.1 type 11 methyltransferase [Amycolatopsis acidiphila]